MCAQTSAAVIEARQVLAGKRKKLGLDEDECEGIQLEKSDGEGDTEEAVIHEEEQYSPSATSNSVEGLDDEVNEVLCNSKFL
jgi:hypothetical protein